MSWAIRKVLLPCAPGESREALVQKAFDEVAAQSHNDAAKPILRGQANTATQIVDARPEVAFIVESSGHIDRNHGGNADLKVWPADVVV